MNFSLLSEILGPLFFILTLSTVYSSTAFHVVGRCMHSLCGCEIFDNEYDAREGFALLCMNTFSLYLCMYIMTNPMFKSM